MGTAITMTEAARRLGITRVTLGRLVREGKLSVVENPLDKRQRLIQEDAIRALQRERDGGLPVMEGGTTADSGSAPNEGTGTAVLLNESRYRKLVREARRREVTVDVVIAEAIDRLPSHSTSR